MPAQNFSKIILVRTHNGKRPFGTHEDEAQSPDCQEIERKLGWIKAGASRREMIWKIYYTCGQCVGIIYTGITKKAAP